VPDPSDMRSFTPPGLGREDGACGTLLQPHAPPGGYAGAAWADIMVRAIAPADPSLCRLLDRGRETAGRQPLWTARASTVEAPCAFTETGQPLLDIVTIEDPTEVLHSPPDRCR
jgi:hypothetical protein